eukprot:6647192-Prymnesium_polylepis.2
MGGEVEPPKEWPHTMAWYHQFEAGFSLSCAVTPARFLPDSSWDTRVWSAGSRPCSSRVTVYGLSFTGLSSTSSSKNGLNFSGPSSSASGAGCGWSAPSAALVDSGVWASRSVEASLASHEISVSTGAPLPP